MDGVKIPENVGWTSSQQGSKPGLPSYNIYPIDTYVQPTNTGKQLCALVSILN